MSNLSYFGKVKNLMPTMNNAYWRKKYHMYTGADITDTVNYYANSDAAGTSSVILNENRTLSELLDSYGYIWDYRQEFAFFHEPLEIMPSLSVHYSNANGLAYPTAKGIGIARDVYWSNSTGWCINDISSVFDMTEVPTTEDGLTITSYGINFTDSTIGGANTIAIRYYDDSLQVRLGNTPSNWWDILSDVDFSTSSIYIAKATSDEKALYHNGLYFLCVIDSTYVNYYITEDFFTFFSDSHERSTFSATTTSAIATEAHAGRVKILPNKCFIISNLDDLTECKLCKIRNIRNLSTTVDIDIPSSFVLAYTTSVTSGGLNLGFGPTASGQWILTTGCSDIPPIVLSDDGKNVMNDTTIGYNGGVNMVGRSLSGATEDDGPMYMSDLDTANNGIMGFNMTSLFKWEDDEDYNDDAPDLAISISHDSLGKDDFSVVVNDGEMEDVSLFSIDTDFSGYIGSNSNGVESEVTCGLFKTTKLGKLDISGDTTEEPVNHGDNNAEYGLDTWTSSTMPSNLEWYSVCYGNGKFVAIAYGSATCAYSTDGINWTNSTMPSSEYWRSVCYGNGMYISVAYYTDTCAYSTDGINWTNSTMPISEVWTSVCYGNGVYVAVASMGSDTCAYSTDGINWTSSTMPSSEYWQFVCYGNGMYVAIAYGTTCAYSTDGINWTSSTMPSSEAWQSVCYGNGMYVAVANMGTSTCVYSTDGINWTSSTMPSSLYWISVCYGNGMYVALALNTTTCAYSTDGINWSSSTMPSSTYWQSVCYGNGVYVAVASSTTCAYSFPLLLPVTL